MQRVMKRLSLRILLLVLLGLILAFSARDMFSQSHDIRTAEDKARLSELDAAGLLPDTADPTAVARQMAEHDAGTQSAREALYAGWRT